MPYIGMAVGGVLAVTILGLLVGLAFKSKEPDERAMYTGGAWVLAGVFAGFGMADGGPYRWDAILLYVPGLIVAYLYLRWYYRKGWVEDDA